MKRSNHELIVGGVIIAALFVLVAGVLWLKQVSMSSRLVQYTVLFPNIGTLQQGDPVTVNGVKQGQVSRIELRGTDVAVSFKLEKSVRFTDSSVAIIQNIGLMGERQLGIRLSSKGMPHIPDEGKEVTYIVGGRFDSGIAEAMGMLGTVLEDVTALVDTARVIVDRTVGDTAFVTFFKTVTGRLDTAVYLANAILKDNRADIDGAVGDLREVAGDLKGLVDRNGGRIDNIAANGEVITADAAALLKRVDTISVTLKDIIDGVDRGEGSVGRLVQDSTIITDLQTSVNHLDTLVGDVSRNGLKLRVRLGFGKGRK